MGRREREENEHPDPGVSQASEMQIAEMGGQTARNAAGSAAGTAAGIAGALFVFGLAVLLILHCRPLYRLDIKLFSLEKVSGMDEASILRNYDALIAYNSIFFRGPLEFPDLPMSATARIHFEEVRRIFCGIEILGAAGGILFLAGLAGKRTRRRTLLTAGACLTGIPVIVLLLGLGGWERFFIGFHQLFFRNTYWLFDPATDPVILLLPDGYFLHCVIGIAVLILAGGILCLAAGIRCGKNTGGKTGSGN